MKMNNNRTFNLFKSAINNNTSCKTTNALDTSNQMKQEDFLSANNHEHQMALASIFNSLSSLAASSQQHSAVAFNNQTIPFPSSQQQQLHSRPHQQQATLRNSPQASASSSSSSSPAPSNQSSPMTLMGQQHQAQPATSISSLTSSSLALTNSLQSVMAAAMMQQQLVASNQLQHQHSPTTSTSALGLIGQVADQQQQLLQQQQQQPFSNNQQRINYCTICNKELCNKYFMKTHMFKMHGINLEMENNDTGEQRASEADEDEDQDEERDEDQEEADNEEVKSNSKRSADDALDVAVADSDQAEERRNGGPKEAGDSAKSPNSLNSSAAEQSSGKQSVVELSGNKDANHAATTSGKKVKSCSNSKQTTSVMNGFAGNSMGGVVCDICNKELCSKYFLKVHKQNTHGISDYQDMNQFPIYPFSNQNPFLNAVTATTLPQTNVAANQQQQAQQHEQICSFAPMLGGLPSLSSINSQSLEQAKSINRLKQEFQLDEDEASGNVRKIRTKKVKLSKHQKATDHEQRRREQVGAVGGAQQEQYESVYRAMIAQQQQQQQVQPMLGASPAGGPFWAPMEQLVGNPLSTLMCFGAMGPFSPFGPTGMSPAMIVDHILKNQHLFNRNNLMGNNSPKQNEDTDGNNNSSNISEPIKGKGPKEPASGASGSASGGGSSSSSRYFTHYTEACPMCDRRFKSIKWLKTHMMNDHKQEIGSYMQMMMQYLYSSKRQQMAAAATMAAIEQQQQQQQQLQQQSLAPHQQPQHLEQPDIDNSWR